METIAIQQTINLHDVCHLCGSKMECIYTEEGSSDFLDVYKHICKCGYEECIETYHVGMSSREEDGPDPCPFCGRKVE